MDKKDDMKRKKNIKWKETKCLLENFKKRDFVQKEILGIS